HRKDATRRWSDADLPGPVRGAWPEEVGSHDSEGGSHTDARVAGGLGAIHLRALPVRGVARALAVVVEEDGARAEGEQGAAGRRVGHPRASVRAGARSRRGAGRVVDDVGDARCWLVAGEEAGELAELEPGWIVVARDRARPDPIGRGDLVLAADDRCV